MASDKEIPLPKMPWIQLGELDPASTLTPPPAKFPDNTSSQQRAAMRFTVNGNAVGMFCWPTRISGEMTMG